VLKIIKILALSLVIVVTRLNAEPIKVHPSNPHYFLFKGQPTVLITSAEHYGAVINRDFDYVAYFDALKSYGLNYTRIYPGELFEPVGKFMKGNTLGPKPASLIVPWARSKVPGYMLGGNKFDLDQWDPAYFARLKDFVAKGAERGIVVEICFFNGQYSDTWPISPLYYENNIQGVGRCDPEDVQTLRHQDLVRREDDYVRKIIQEVNAYDNVILEICDEAMVGGTPISDCRTDIWLPNKWKGPWEGLTIGRPTRMYRLSWRNTLGARDGWEACRPSIMNTERTSHSSLTKPTTTRCIRETRSRIPVWKLGSSSWEAEAALTN
jgi:hypothetical protein